MLSLAPFLVVDASLWVARLVPQDVFHDTVRTWMDARRQEGTRFIAPALLLPEIAGAISRRTGNAELAKRAVEHLEHLPGLQLVKMDNSLLTEASHLAADLGLRGADSTYVAVAHRLQIPLATLDDDQRQRGRKRVSLIDLSPD